MFMNDVNKTDLIKSIAIQDLRNFGVKYRNNKNNVGKKQKLPQELRSGRRVFKIALGSLPQQTVTLTSGQQLIVPEVLHKLCSFILARVETEGLFRKGGSKSRQNGIKLSLDAGRGLLEENHEIDVANILKTFFRELPEPLFPLAFHETFLHCSILQDNKLQALFLTCLLLPSEVLYTLSYFMQFLNTVSEYCDTNKMDSYNLAVVIGPTLFPTEEKLGVTTTNRLTKIRELIQILIDNACNIGVIPEEIIDRIIPLTSSSVNSLCDDDVSIKGKKKRRSGSLTRMFNGLRKMVGGKSVEDPPTACAVAPDLLSTPSLTKSSKKRKLESAGFSNKKKREVLKTLPDGMVLGTPVSVNPNFKNSSPERLIQKPATFKEKKSQWNLGSRRVKRPKPTEVASSSNVYSLAGTKAILERRWSAVSQAAGFRRNKNRLSADVCTSQKSMDLNLNCDIVMEYKKDPEADYVKVPRTEYEDIKSRVSAIERRISLELDQFEGENKEGDDANLIQVQNAYEKTLVQAEPLSPTTDQLAKRLSKELKIRRSVEQKIIRSPSARKIGSLRRRSRERDRQATQLLRTKSCHTGNSQSFKINLRRGQPNTVSTGLSPVAVKISQDYNKDLAKLKSRASFNNTTSPKFARGCRRSSSTTQSSYSKSDLNEQGSEMWTSAEGFFVHMKTPNSFEELANCRASLAKLRCQNAGMVLAKARLFDNLVDSDNTNNVQEPSNPKAGRKIGQVRNSSRSITRGKSFRYDEKNLSRHNTLSPKKRCLKSPKSAISSDEKENEMIVENNLNLLNSAEKSVLKDCNRIEVSGKALSPCYITSKRMPHIKKSMIVKSPKRLCRTPLGNERQTPLKVVSSSKRVF